MAQVLAQKRLIPSNVSLGQGQLKNAEYLRIGQNFMSLVSEVRNVPLPTISDNDYLTLGKIVSKLIVNTRSGKNNTNLLNTQLKQAVNTVLSSTILSSTAVAGGYSQLSTTSSTTGLMSNNTNALIGQGGQISVKNGLASMTGSVGDYSNSYKPATSSNAPAPFDPTAKLYE